MILASNDNHPANATRGGAQGKMISTNIDWEICEPNTYECKALFCPEDGGYTVYALRLQGCATQGDTIDEAIANIKDAFRECILSYRDDGKEIPWDDLDDVERPTGSFEQWVCVYV